MNLNVQHGKLSVYTAGCRCSSCRALAAAYQKEYRSRPAVRRRINTQRRERNAAFRRFMEQQVKEGSGKKTTGNNP